MLTGPDFPERVAVLGSFLASTQQGPSQGSSQIRVEMHSKDSIESCGSDDLTSETAGCAGFDEIGA